MSGSGHYRAATCSDGLVHGRPGPAAARSGGLLLIVLSAVFVTAFVCLILCLLGFFSCRSLLHEPQARVHRIVAEFSMTDIFRVVERLIFIVLSVHVNSLQYRQCIPVLAEKQQVFFF
jgi:glycerol-3-phosphate acyltransferase PlsY